MSQGATLFAYVVAGVFFILTLRGLSSPETARKGNMFGMVGMAIAILTTLTNPVVQEYMQRKAGNIDRWLAGMRRLRDKTGEGQRRS